MFVRKLAAAAIAFALMGGSAQAQDAVADALSAMRHYNLVVLRDMETNQEVEGRAFIGGNLSGNASQYNLDKLSGGYGLTVGGTATGSAKTAKAGDIRIGGNITSGVEFGGVPEGQVLNYGGTISGGPVNVNSPNTKVYDAGLSATIAAEKTKMASDFDALVNELYTYTYTDEVTFGDGNAYFQPTSNGDVAVYTLNDLSIFQNKNVVFGNQANYKVIVINILSTGSMSTPGGMNFNGPSNTNVIWNFGKMGVDKTLTLNNGWYGSILAPKANVVNGNTAIEGSMVFGSLRSTGEIHTPGLNVNDWRTAVPEPATWAMMIMGFGAAGAMMRRRRAMTLAA